MRRKCVQDARKRNFTAECLNTFVAHWSFQLGEDMVDVAFYAADVNDTGTNICCQICYPLVKRPCLLWGSCGTLHRTFHIRKCLIESLIQSKLDYCNAVFSPLHYHQIKRLQRRVQTTCACRLCAVEVSHSLAFCPQFPAWNFCLRMFSNSFGLGKFVRPVHILLSRNFSQ